MNWESHEEIVELVSSGRGTRRRAGDLDQPPCYLGDHPIENGQAFVELKFVAGRRRAVCFACANPLIINSSSKWFEPDHK